MNDEAAITVRLDDDTVVRLAAAIRDDREFRIAYNQLRTERHEDLVSRVLRPDGVA